MSNPVSRSESLGQYNWGDGCYGWSLVDTETVSVKQELMPPDTAEKLHYHERSTQFFFILKGNASITIDGEQSMLKPLQGIEIKPMQKHCICNSGQTDLEFILYSHPSTKNNRINCEQ